MSDQRFFWHGSAGERPRVCSNCFRETEDPAIAAHVSIVKDARDYIYVICAGCGARELILVNMP